jgi:acyl carrier protein
VIGIASGIFHVPENRLDERSDQDNTDGWDSLAFLELIMHIERTFGFTIPPKDIMNTRTLGDAMRIVRTHKEEGLPR